MRKYIKKIDLCEAVFYDGSDESMDKILKLHKKGKRRLIKYLRDGLMIFTKKGCRKAFVNDWVVMDRLGELFPVNNKEFHKDYALYRK